MTYSPSVRRIACHNIHDLHGPYGLHDRTCRLPDCPTSSLRAPCHETQGVEPRPQKPQCMHQRLRVDQPWLFHGYLLHSLDVPNTITKGIGDFDVLDVRDSISGIAEMFYVVLEALIMLLLDGL
jgi:hypothetical protein